RHTRCLSDWSSDVCSSDLEKLRIRSPLRDGDLRRFAAQAHPLVKGLVAFALLEHRQQRRLVFFHLRLVSRLAFFHVNKQPAALRSEERRVGKECRSRWLWD